MRKVLKKIWESWKRLAHKIGRFQTVVLLSIFYFLIISPIGLVMRLFGWNPLDTRFRDPRRTSNWKPVKDAEPDLNSMRRMS
jgi:hypothetical protein